MLHYAVVFFVIAVIAQRSGEELRCAADRNRPLGDAAPRGRSRSAVDAGRLLGAGRSARRGLIWLQPRA